MVNVAADTLYSYQSQQDINLLQPADASHMSICLIDNLTYAVLLSILLGCVPDWEMRQNVRCVVRQGRADLPGQCPHRGLIMSCAAYSCHTRCIRATR